MDFIDKKENLVNILEEYLNHISDKEKLLEYVDILYNDNDFKDKELFKNIFNELKNNLEELSRKELKQRILMIKGYID